MEEASHCEEVTRIRQRLARLDLERANLEARLSEIEGAATVEKSAPQGGGPVTSRSPMADKVALFRSLFMGREDVHAKRWENARTGKSGYAPVCGNEWKPGICGKPSVRCSACPHQAFLPVTDDAVEAHLRGRHTIGIYPMLPDDTCRFLASDFDKESWQRDAEAFLAACRLKGVPAALERSRSGGGGHVWIFLKEPMPASLARHVGAHLLTEAIAGEAGRQGRVVGLGLPLDDEDEEPWTAPPSGRKPLPVATGSLPERVDAVLADQIYVPRAGLPPALTNRLIRLAAFQNPAFYGAQAMRRSTFGIPRIVACAELLSHHIALPRGCLETMEQSLEELGIRLHLRDERNPGRPLEAAFLGKLTEEQKASADALLSHDAGVLSAATAFGKTVVAASLIAARKTSTLVLVHRRQLMDQWIARLGAFLDVPGSAIGRIGGGRRDQSGLDAASAALNRWRWVACAAPDAVSSRCQCQA